MDLYGIIGAGGFGREVMPVLREQLQGGTRTSELIFADDAITDEQTINGHRATSLNSFLEAKADNKYAAIAIANHTTRQRLCKKLTQAGVIPVSIKALTCVCLDEVEIGEGAILCPQTAITSNVSIGKYFHLNIFSYVAHDCIIGDYVTFAPNVHCNGTVTIEDYAYIGSGAIIRNSTAERKITIGEGAIVGMGSVVTKSVPPHTTVAGNPARKIARNA